MTLISRLGLSLCRNEVGRLLGDKLGESGRTLGEALPSADALGVTLWDDKKIRKEGGGKDRKDREIEESRYYAD